MRRSALFRACALCVLIATLAASSALIVSAQGQWFDAYREGRTAFQTKDWAVAESKLKEALAKRPEQGRNVPVPDRAIVYLPEYYLGLVYVQQGRFREARESLERVLSNKLVQPQHPEYPDLQRALDECRRGDLASLKARTAKLDVVNADGEPETGSGFIVTAAKGLLHIVTALHVLAPEDGPAKPKSISVRLFAGDDRALAGPFDAEYLPDRIDEDLDLAVVRVKVSPAAVGEWSPWEFRREPIQSKERILTIGHAVADFNVTENNEVLNPVARAPGRFVISTAGIGQMASGGPVIDRRGQLMGVMVLILPGAASADAVHVNEVARLLKLWSIDMSGPAQSNR